MRSFGSGTLGFFLRTAGLLFGLALGHFLSPLRCLLLSAHLLLFGGTTCLLLRTLHLSLLLAACRFFSLTLSHLLSTAFGFLLRTHLLFFSGAACLLLRTLHFSLLLAACLLLRLALRHLLSAAFGFLLGAHLLFFSSTTCGLLLLALHGCGFSLLPGAFGFRSGGLFGGHAFSSGALLLGCHLLLLLRCRLLTSFFSLGGGLVGSHAFSGGALLLRCRLLTSFFSLGGGLVGSHALLLGGQRLLLRCGGLHAAFFRFSVRSGLFSGPFFSHATFLHLLLLALLHAGMALFPSGTKVSFLSFGGCVGGSLLSRHFFCCRRLLRSAGFSRGLWQGGWCGG